MGILAREEPTTATLSPPARGPAFTTLDCGCVVARMPLPFMTARERTDGEWLERRCDAAQTLAKELTRVMLAQQKWRREHKRVRVASRDPDFRQLNDLYHVVQNTLWRHLGLPT